MVRRVSLLIIVLVMLMGVLSFAEVAFDNMDDLLEAKLREDVEASGLKKDGFVRLNYWGESFYKLLVEQDFSMFKSSLEEEVVPNPDEVVVIKPKVKGVLSEDDKVLFKEWLYEKSVELGYVESGMELDFEDVFVNQVLKDKDAVNKYRAALMKILKVVVDDTTEVLAKVVGGGTGRLKDGNFTVNIISPMNETSNVMFLGGTSYGVPFSADYMRVIMGDGFSRLTEIVPELQGVGYNDLYVPNIVYFYTPCSEGMRLISNSLPIKALTSSVILRGKVYPIELYLDNIGVYAVPKQIDIYHDGEVKDYDLVFKDEKFLYKNGDFYIYASDVNFPVDSSSAFVSKGQLYVEGEKGSLVIYVPPVSEEEQKKSEGNGIMGIIWAVVFLGVFLSLVLFIFSKIFKRKRKNNMLEVFEDVGGGTE